MPIYEQRDVGCCLNCSESELGCLCYECQCSNCNYYSSHGYCEISHNKKKEMVSNLKVSLSSDKWLDVRILGQVNKENYAKIKPFLQQHLRYDEERKSYCYFNPNPKFIPWLIKEIERAGFEPQTEGLGECF